MKIFNLSNPNNPLNKSLKKEEIKEFRQWAKDNYQQYDEIKGVWHPIVQFECVLINAGIDSKLLNAFGGE
jgi:hypothetical protein